MFKVYSMISVILLVTSCSNMITNSSKSVSAELTTEEMEQIENADFLPSKEIQYETKLDRFDISKDNDKSADSLLNESIGRISEPKLKLISDDQDPISKIVSLCYQKNFDDADMVMDAVYKKYKSHPSYWNQLGTCYFLKNNLRKALLYYNKSRSLSVKYAPSINNLGVIYQKQGLEQKALLAFQKASQLSSFSLTPIFNLAQIYLKYGFSLRARKLFESLLRESPNDADALSGMATSYLQENKLTKAIEYYFKIPERLRQRPEVGINLSIALKMIGRPKDAVDVFDDVSTKSLAEYTSYYNRVEKFVRTKK